MWTTNIDLSKVVLPAPADDFKCWVFNCLLCKAIANSPKKKGKP